MPDLHPNQKKKICVRRQKEEMKTSPFLAFVCASLGLEAPEAHRRDDGLRLPVSSNAATPSSLDLAQAITDLAGPPRAVLK